ncbi:MAG: signal peptidase II [Saccharofermentanales bacterium]|jgi:signal peptidase II
METLIIVVLMILDQWTKGMAERHIGAGPAVEVIPGFFHLECTYNPGAAWSFLADKSWGIWLLSIISTVVMIALILCLRRARGPKAKTVLIMLIAGSGGNLIDRLRFGAVADFLAFTFGDYAFPTFNVADSLITIGAVLLIIFLIFDHHFIHDVFPDGEHPSIETKDEAPCE